MGNCNNYCGCIDEKSGIQNHEMRGSMDVGRPISTLGSGRDPNMGKFNQQQAYGHPMQISKQQAQGYFGYGHI